MVHTSLSNQILVYIFIIVLFGADLAHFELHHIAGKCSSLIRKHVADLSKLLIDCASIDFASLTIELFIFIVLNHLNVNFHKIGLCSFSDLYSDIKRNRYKSVV